jgi:hypothetical protein
MYTILSTGHLVLRLAVFALLLTAGLAGLAAAQDPPPTRLPGMTSTATPLPGVKIMVGVVRDTSGFPIPGAEVIIPGLAKRLIANEEGIFRFDGVPKGVHTMRARKIGYAPQIREFAVDTAGGIAEFELVPMAKALPAMVTSADRLGISGIVGDTAYQSMPEATVRLLGNGKETATDSLGRFYLPAGPGKYVVSIRKPGYKDKIVSVTVPKDSGRRIMAWLQPRIGPVPVREAHNIDDLQSRIAWVKPADRLYYTHEDLVKLGSEWAYDAVQSAWSRDIVPPKKDPYSRDCMVVVNGGPAIMNLAHLTVDEVESLEIYVNGSSQRGTPGRISLGKRGRPVAATTPANYSNLDRYAIENGARICPKAIYVWLR